MKKIITLLIFLLPNFVIAQEVKIGVLPSLTGPFADLGEDCRQGVELATKALAPEGQIGKRKLKLVYGDSQADPKIAVNEFKKLIEQDKVLGVVSIRSTVCLPLNPISMQKHVPLLCGSGHPNFQSGNPFAYQAWPLTDVEGAQLADYVLSKKVKKVAVITGEDEWLLSLSTKFIEHFKTNKGEIVASEEVIATDYDYNSLLTKIKSKKPEGLFVNLSLAQGAVVIKRARELGFDIPIYSNFWSGEQSALDAAGKASEGIVYTESALDFPIFNQELAKLKNAKKPSGATLSCFASAAAAIGAIKTDDSINTPEALHKALLNNLDNVSALDVKIPIIDRRFMFPMEIKQIRDAKVVVIKK